MIIILTSPLSFRWTLSSNVTVTIWLSAALLCGCGSFFSGELAADGDGREPQGKGGSVSRCFAHLVYRRRRFLSILHFKHPSLLSTHPALNFSGSNKHLFTLAHTPHYLTVVAITSQDVGRLSIPSLVDVSPADAPLLNHNLKCWANCPLKGSLLDRCLIKLE